MTGPPRAPLAPAALILSLMLTGCWSGPADVPLDNDCDSRLGEVLPDSGNTDEVTAELVFMIDTSASMANGAGEMPDFSSSVAEIVEHDDFYGTNGDRLLSVGYFGGAQETPKFQLNRLLVPRVVGSEHGRSNQAKLFRECLEEFLGANPPSPAATEGSDVLTGVTTGARRFATTGDGATRSLHVFTDGLVNVGCLDMNRYFDLELTDEELSEGCVASGETPEDGLGGIEVNVVLQPAPAAELDNRQLPLIEDFWNTVCDIHDGSRPCATAPGESATTETTVPTDGDPVEDPEVVLPKPKPSEPDREEIPAAMLFDFDSAELRDSAETVLDEVAERRPDRTAPITVIGHTDSKGSDSYNDDLSLRRSRAVAAELTARGFTDVTAHGRGSREPSCTGDYDDNGRLLDPVCARENRRVVLEYDGDRT
ncbi:OmpA family protein [Nocardiopsis sp. LDBS0036]|uniref:OmpA family protein n=1 Tax=Nocardiopsis sp. LDBS0036 TaxID=3104276 RepID=UPI0035173154